jgi:hypothetical protein
LPVRIDIVDYNADQTPLFIGTSVVPTVYIHKPPTGPDAGKFLQAYVPQGSAPPSTSPGPTASASGAHSSGPITPRASAPGPVTSHASTPGQAQ